MKFYIALNSIYDINIVKKWKTYSKLFNGFIESDVDKVAAQGHLLLVVIDYFMKKFPDIKKYNATFLKLLFDGDTFNESFLKDWYYKKVRLDKSSPLYKKSLEKDYKQSVEQFIEWLEQAEEESEEEDEDEEVEEVDEKKKEAREKAKKMKELIEQEQIQQKVRTQI